MRILVVQESDWIIRGPHQSHHLMERLSKRGHEIRIIDFEILWRQQNKGGLISKRKVFKNVHKAIEDGAVTVIRPPIVKLPALDYLSLIFTHRNEIQRQIDEFHPDVIIGFGILNANIALSMAKKNCISFIYYILDELHCLVREKLFRDLARFIESQNMRNADKVISINEGLREYTMQMGAPKERTAVIRAGIDIKRYDLEGRNEIRDRYGIKDDDILLFFMGWLYDFSGVKEVALELVKQKDNRFKLLVVGNGDLWISLQNIKNEYKLNEKLILVEWVEYEEVPRFLSASDICILPSYKNEIMKNIVPIKLYEYMAAGKPVIATKLNGLIKEFGEENGIIYIDFPEEIFAKLDHLNFDDYVIQGLKAKRFVHKLNWDKIVKEFEDLLGELISA